MRSRAIKFLLFIGISILLISYLIWYITSSIILELKNLSNSPSQACKNELIKTHDSAGDFKYICCYQDPNHPNDNVGRPFKVEKSMVKFVDLYLNSPGINDQEKIKYVLDRKPQPITAFSQNHYSEHIEHIESALRVFKGQHIVVYDLGMSPSQVEYVKRNESLIYKKFLFKNFPPHVSILTTYAWKTIIWAQMLRRYHAITWFDTSMTWYHTTGQEDFKKVVQKHIMDRNSSILYYGHAIGHSNAWGTNARMWGYFPSNMTEHSTFTGNTMKSAKGVILVNTEDFKQNVMKWALSCALVEDCISPMEVTGKRVTKWCPKEKETEDQGYICHHFDQSLFSLLAHNYYSYNSSIYSLGDTDEFLGRPRRVISRFAKSVEVIEI